MGGIYICVLVVVNEHETRPVQGTWLFAEIKIHKDLVKLRLYTQDDVSFGKLFQCLY